MSILIEQPPAGTQLCFPESSLLGAHPVGAVRNLPTRGSIVALDAADAFAVLLHRRIMAESIRIERAVRDARD